MQIFVETHFYDGGFKSELVSHHLRPSVLPSPDHVGLKSSEVQLAAGEFTFELSFFRQGPHFVSWIGCYTLGEDNKLGDRGTYCGVGVWLVDGTLKHGLHLMNFLMEATKNLAATNVPSSEARFKLTEFATAFSSLEWATDSAVCHPGGVGSPPAPSYIFLNTDRASLELTAIDILGQFLIGSRSTQTIRRVYFLTNASQIFVRQTERLSYHNAVTYAEHIIHSVGALALDRAGIQKTNANDRLAG